MVKRSPNAFIILIRIGQRTSNVSQLTSYKALLKPKILEKNLRVSKQLGVSFHVDCLPTRF